MNHDSSDANNGERKGFGNFAYLSPLAVIALSFRYAVGWGSFVLPGTMFLPNAGPIGTIIGFLIGTVAIAVLAFNFHRMTVSIQGSGGTYEFVTKTFGQNHGFLMGWFLFLTYIAILWANATALVLLARFLFGDALQVGFHYTMVGFDVYFGEVLLCLAAIILCGCVCILGKRFAIRIHTFFAFVLIAGVVTCFVAALLEHKGGMAAMEPAFSTVRQRLRGRQGKVLAGWAGRTHRQATGSERTSERVETTRRVTRNGKKEPAPDETKIAETGRPNGQ